jgi:hypothetical protein
LPGSLRLRARRDKFHQKLFLNQKPVFEALFLVGWIRIRIVNADSDPGGQNDDKKISEAMISFDSFEGWRLL